MIRKHKGKLIITSLLTLLPIVVGLLLWDKLPERFATHWGADGQADGWSSLPFAVFAPPVIMLVVFWLCVLVTEKEGSNKDRNQKPLGLVLWIVPILSNLCCGMMYSLALGADFPVTNVMIVFMGLMFVAIGNYLPKCRYNYTLGIKLPWTFSCEENWNATHRFGGKVWMIGGAVMALCALLPGFWGMIAMLVGMILLVAIPTVYSYRFYRKQKQAGDTLLPMPGKRGSKISLAGLAVVLILVAVLMFTGSVEVQYGETGFTVDSVYHDALTVEYAAIDSVEYREDFDPGVRVMGFGSARLLLGTFENEECGNYTLYAYTNSDAWVVVTVGEKTMVIGGADAAETQAIYQALLQRIGK